jgi:hypothetical protein
MIYTLQAPSPWDVICWMCLGGLDGHKYTAGEALYKLWLAEDSPFVWVRKPGINGTHWLAPAGKNGFPMVRCARMRFTDDWRSLSTTQPPLVGGHSPAAEARMGRPIPNGRESYLWNDERKRWDRQGYHVPIEVRNASWGLCLNEALRNAEAWHRRNISLESHHQIVLLDAISRR